MTSVKSGPKRTILRVALAAVWSLFVVAGFATGAGPGLVMLALVPFVLGVLALLIGRARWAFLADRKRAGLVVAGAFALLVVGVSLAPTPAPVVAASAPVAVTTTAPPSGAASSTVPVTTTVAESTTTTTTTTEAPLPTTTVVTTTTTTAQPPAPVVPRVVATTTTFRPPPVTTTTTRYQPPQPPAAAPAPGGSESVGGCEPSYPTICIPVGVPDLDCGDIPHRNFVVRAPDPHKFDGGRKDGIGCQG